MLRCPPPLCLRGSPLRPRFGRVRGGAVHILYCTGFVRRSLSAGTPLGRQALVDQWVGGIGEIRLVVRTTVLHVLVYRVDVQAALAACGHVVNHRYALPPTVSQELHAGIPDSGSTHARVLVATFASPTNHGSGRLGSLELKSTIGNALHGDNSQTRVNNELLLGARGRPVAVLVVEQRFNPRAFAAAQEEAAEVAWLVRRAYSSGQLLLDGVSAARAGYLKGSDAADV